MVLNKEKADLFKSVYSLDFIKGEIYVYQPLLTLILQYMSPLLVIVIPTPHLVQVLTTSQWEAEPYQPLAIDLAIKVSSEFSSLVINLELIHSPVNGTSGDRKSVV